MKRFHVAKCEKQTTEQINIFRYFFLMCVSTHIEIHRGKASRNYSKILTGFTETVILLLWVFSSIPPPPAFFFGQKTSITCLNFYF